MVLIVLLKKMLKNLKEIKEGKKCQEKDLKIGSLLKFVMVN